VHLAADALVACEVQAQRGTRRVARKEQFSFAPGHRAAALQSLCEWMGGGSWRTSQEWVLGIAEVRYVLLQWTTDLADAKLREAFAAALFEQQFKHDAGGYAMRFAKSPYGCAQLVAFVPNDLLAELEARARASKIRLASVVPSVAAVWDRFSAVLERETGALHVIDGDRQVVLHHAKGRLEEVALRPFSAANSETLSSMAGSEAQLRFFSSAPIRGKSGAVLSLADGDGFLTTQDAAYAFALCGVF
jgi:hypothetical protein